MVKQQYIFLSILAAVFLLGSRAEAFVVQSPSKAFSFRNTSRDVGFPRAQKNTEPPADVDSPVDYEEIADKLIVNTAPEKIYIDLHRDSAKNISASPGQTFFVILPEPEGSSWHIESSKLVEIVSSEHTGQKRILEFRVLCCGDDTVFLDNLILQDSRQQVLQSRILRLRVKK